MAIECKCGELAAEGQTFCRHCGSRLQSRKRDSGSSVKLKREGSSLPPLRDNRPPRIRIPPPQEAQPPTPHPVVHSGGNGALIAVGAVILAVGAIATALWIQSMSDTESRPDSTVRSTSRPNLTVIGGSNQGTSTAPTTTSGGSTSSSATAPTSESEFDAADKVAAGAAIRGYVAQLGSFRNQELAEERRAALEAQGTDAQVVMSSDYRDLSPGYWVVLSGPFGSKEEAEAAAADSGVSDAFTRWISG